MEWRVRDQNAKLGAILDCCLWWESEGRAPVPTDCIAWSDALGALGSRAGEPPRPTSVPAYV